MSRRSCISSIHFDFLLRRTQQSLHHETFARVPLDSNPHRSTNPVNGKYLPEHKQMMPNYDMYCALK